MHTCSRLPRGLTVACVVLLLVGMAAACTFDSNSPAASDTATAANTATASFRNDPPTPDATALAQLTAIVAHYQGRTPEPLFTGELNGFLFKVATAPRYLTCPGEIRPYGTASEHGSPLLASSGLDYTASYIPSGMQAEFIMPMSSPDTGHVSVALCRETGAVIRVSEYWKSANASLSISREAAGPVVTAYFSGDRLQATSFNDRAAVIVKPRYDGEAIYIYLRDGRSFWSISSSGLSLDEVQSVAEGLE